MSDQPAQVNMQVDSPLVPRFPPGAAPNGGTPPPQQASNGQPQQPQQPQQPGSPPPPPQPDPQPDTPPQAEVFADEAPPEPWVIPQDDGKIKLRLRKPVPAHGDKVDFLLFREPTGGDIERIGNPVAMGGGGINFDAPVMTAMMSHLAGVPTSAIRLMHSKDWSNGAFAIWNFFTPDAFR